MPHLIINVYITRVTFAPRRAKFKDGVVLLDRDDSSAFPPLFGVEAGEGCSLISLASENADFDGDGGTE